MRKFYVRPQCAAGYGSGDGTSYENAWNGLQSVEWSAMSVGEPAQLWVCGDPQGQPGFMTVFVEWSYIATAAAIPQPESVAAT
ncbi:MAG TPA: hypothetical protein VM140_10190 [Burkholderiales bacterium]|nr:hypothetical protein [Burkholderiales bacterium]